MELMQAHHQWMRRPEDERYTSLEAMHADTLAYAQASRERPDVPLSTLKPVAVDGDVMLIGRGGEPCALTHWSFGQVSARLGAPASYLRTLPADLAVANLQHGLVARLAEAPDCKVAILGAHDATSDRIIVRALTGNRYARIWNHEVITRLLDLQSTGQWEVARPDIRVRDGRLPLYASAHDMFAMMRSVERTITEPGNGDGLRRGVIVENSEVGASTLRLTRFLYRAMCGNHIIWDASDVVELAIRHVGSARDRMHQWDTTIKRYMDASATDDEARVRHAQTTRIAATKDDLLDAVFARRIPGLTRTAIAAGYDAAVPDVDGDPRTIWGLMQGLTRHSQTLPYADERTALDRAAGRLASVF